ncbi:MAG: hypothetical protein ACREOS_00385, partial [Candidatus Dormibacteraceae bacterium]
MHLKEGALRRLYDEPFSLTGSMREHFDSCPRCQERLQVMAGEAREVLGRMVVEGSTVDAVAALNVVRRRLTPPVRRRFALPSLGWKAPVLAAALVAALVSVVAFTPPLAARLTSIFSPQHVTPVAIQSGSLTGLDALSTYGAVNWSGRPQLETADTAQAAAQKSGLPLINPGYLPSAVVGKPVGYGATTRADVSFTFSQAKARQAAQAAGRSVPNFPAGADGSVMKVTIGPAEAAIYGDLRQVLKAAGSSTSTSSAEQSILSAGPFLAVAESRAPVVSSSGMSVSQLKQLLLSQPGLSPQLR